MIKLLGVIRTKGDQSWISYQGYYLGHKVRRIYLCNAQDVGNLNDGELVFLNSEIMAWGVDHLIITVKDVLPLNQYFI